MLDYVATALRYALIAWIVTATLVGTWIAVGAALELRKLRRAKAKAKANLEGIERIPRQKLVRYRGVTYVYLRSLSTGPSALFPHYAILVGLPQFRAWKWDTNNPDHLLRICWHGRVRTGDGRDLGPARGQIEMLPGLADIDVDAGWTENMTNETAEALRGLLEADR